jgi:hypothetical protein
MDPSLESLEASDCHPTPLWDAKNSDHSKDMGEICGWQAIPR